MRVGVGKLPVHGDMVAHVLGRFAPEDRRLVELSYERAVQAIECILEEDVPKAMSRYNGKVEEA